MNNNLDINKLDFKYTRNFFSITSDNTPINLNINNVHLPFGIENFSNKKILNLEIDNNNNYKYNFITNIQNLEKSLQDIANSKPDEINKHFIELKQLINKKTLISTVKKSRHNNDCHILRTSYSYNTNTYIKKKDGNNIPFAMNSNQLYNCNADIILKGIWIKNNNFGLLFHSKDIHITNIINK